MSIPSKPLGQPVANVLRHMHQSTTFLDLTGEYLESDYKLYNTLEEIPAVI